MTALAQFFIVLVFSGYFYSLFVNILESYYGVAVARIHSVCSPSIVHFPTPVSWYDGIKGYAGALAICIYNLLNAIISLSVLPWFNELEVYFGALNPLCTPKLWFD